MTDTGTAYTATGAAGTAADLGKIGGDYIWGMAVYDGVIYVANDDKISRLDNLPSSEDVNRSLTVTDIATGTISTIYGMTAEGEANVDPCTNLQKFKCNSSPIIYTHSPSGIEKYNISTGQFTTITSTPSHTFFDMGVAPNGKLYGVDSGGGDLYQISKSTGLATQVGTVTLPANTNFNMLAFDKYGEGWFVADGGSKLMSFDPTAVTNGTITPITVVTNLQTAGFPTGSSSGDVFFVDGDMYIAWASTSSAPRDGVRLIRLDMTDTGSAYTATGAAGTAADLGKIEASLVYGMTVHDGIIYVANGDKISRLDTLPSSEDFNRNLTVTDTAVTNFGSIFGMAAEGEWGADDCTDEQYFNCRPSPTIYTHSPSGIEKYNISTGQFTSITNNPQLTYFDVGTTPDGKLYGVVNGGGDLFEIRKSTGVGTQIGTVTLPANTNFNMLAFDKYGKGWFVADGGSKLMSFSPGSGNITPTTVVTNLQTAGFPAGSSAGDVFFVDGDMYIAWASTSPAPRDGVRLIRLDMTDTGTAYTATGAAGTAADLGKIGGNYIWGMAVYDGVIYVANGDKISRLNTLPATSDVNRTIPVTDIATGNIGIIYGMSAEGESEVDSCVTAQRFIDRAVPSAVTTTTTSTSTTTTAPAVGSPTSTAPSVMPVSAPRNSAGTLPTTGSRQNQLFIVSAIFIGLGLVVSRRKPRHESTRV
jgi:LPXTG-motif cell wall-anchored protein